jgi:heme oxygenase (biliverdin-IX-beta and delta-forming)
MIHALLKQRTADLHSSMEVQLGVLLSDEISVGQYAAVQKSFYGFYKPLEDRLVEFLGRQLPEIQLAMRLKLPLLEGDLASLSVPADAIAKLPVCDKLPPLGTVPELLGCLYVLEGSTLGGKIITRHLKTVLSLKEAGCSFFNSYGDNVGRMWSAFLSVLERHCEEYGDQEAIVNSACQTYASLERWFSRAESVA